MFVNDYLFLLPELYLALISSVLLIMGTTLTNYSRKVLVTNFGYLTLFISFLFFFLCLQVPITEYCLLQYQYIATLFSFWFRVVFLLCFFLCLAFTLNYFFFERIFFIEYYFLVSLFCISSFFLVSANDFVLFYFALELQALIVYTMATLKRYTVFSTESGLKYFVLGALSSGLLLFGISLFYGFFGTLNFHDMKFLFLKWSELNLSYTFLLPIAFIMSGLLFKLAAAPFHIWTPDVYEGAPSAVVLFFATLPKLAMFSFLLKFFLV
jgi:NADH-quinone oxidoreductase subunit N